MKMSVLAALLEKEENRNERMIAEYRRELESLPKGSIKPKRVKDKTYYYLAYREGDKIITKYLGKDEAFLLSVREQLARRKQIEEIIKKLREEKTQIKRLEAIL